MENAKPIDYAGSYKLGWIKYDEFTVITILDGSFKGYINTTKLTANKFNDFATLQLYTLLLNSVSKSTNLKINELVFEITDKSEYAGTYYHPHIVPNILLWAFPDFSNRIGKLLSNLFMSAPKKENEMPKTEAPIEKTKEHKMKLQIEIIDIMQKLLTIANS
jgi:hypothetical protein